MGSTLHETPTTHFSHKKPHNYTKIYTQTEWIHTTDTKHMINDNFEKSIKHINTFTHKNQHKQKKTFCMGYIFHTKTHNYTSI
jgi:hypothetical protein